MECAKVSDNERFLVTDSGQPFFWLGDTAWEIFHRLTLEEADHYLDVRRRQGFNVIQSVALAEFDGLRVPNAYGHTPLVDLDPAKPDEAYFAHVDNVIRAAASKDMYIGLLPTWGDKVNKIWGVGPVVFNAENARVYGRSLGRRYRDDANVLWILGGDRPAEGVEAIWDAMAAGIAEGLGRKPFITYHPRGGTGSSQWLHGAAWLDMNMWQSGHHHQNAAIWDMIAGDYARVPTKPVLDGEPNYEDHPIDPWSRTWLPEYGRFTDHDVRKQAYRAVFAGACGHTYGHHSVWQFWSPQRQAINHPAFYWDEAILRPGASQLIHLKNLMLTRSYLDRVPDQSLLLSDPGEGAGHVQATCALYGHYALVYIPQAEQTVQIDLSRLAGPVRASWYDPRDGRTLPIGEFAGPSAAFTTPVAGPDWVLALDVM